MIGLVSPTFSRLLSVSNILSRFQIVPPCHRRKGLECFTTSVQKRCEEPFTSWTTLADQHKGVQEASLKPIRS